MKTLVTLAAMMMAFNFSSGAMAKDGDVNDKVIPINDVYIPSGFDSASDAFLVVNGLFPNSCYRLKNVKVEHIGAALHEVSTFAGVTSGMCLTVMVPFHQEVQLGKLAVGEHKIHFMNGDGTYMEKRLTIEL